MIRIKNNKKKSIEEASDWKQKYMSCEADLTIQEKENDKLIEEDKKKDERNAIGFAHWKDRHFERTYPKTGYFYCLANYESVKLIPGVKYGGHYSFEQLYELYIVSQK